MPFSYEKKKKLEEEEEAVISWEIQNTKSHWLLGT
jgi:hypothetical protein